MRDFLIKNERTPSVVEKARSCLGKDPLEASFGRTLQKLPLGGILWKRQIVRLTPTRFEPAFGRTLQKSHSEASFERNPLEAYPNSLTNPQPYPKTVGIHGHPTPKNSNCCIFGNNSKNLWLCTLVKQLIMFLYMSYMMNLGVNVVGCFWANWCVS